MKKLLLVGFLTVCATVIAFAQDDLKELIDFLLVPPKIANMSMYEALQSGFTYVIALSTLLTVYAVQWLPFLKDRLAYVSGFIRAILVGATVLWIFIAQGGVSDWHALLAFVLANVGWSAAKSILPQTPTSKIRARLCS